MQIIERGPVHPLRDTWRALVAGAVLVLPLALLLAVLDFPYAGETFASFVMVFALLLPFGFIFRLLLHGLFSYVNHGLTLTDPVPRWGYLVYSRPVIALGAACTGAYAVLAVASGLSTGDYSP